MKKRIGRNGKHESLVDVVSPEPANDVKSFVEQAKGQSPKGIFSDIELIEKRARDILKKSGKDLARYHSLEDQKRHAHNTLEYTTMLRHGLETNNIDLAVFAALRAMQEADLILIRHWEVAARTGFPIINPSHILYTDDDKQKWVATAKEIFSDPDRKNKARVKKSRKWLSEQVAHDLELPDKAIGSIKKHFESLKLPEEWEK